MAQVYVNVITRLVIEIDEKTCREMEVDKTVEKVIYEMDYDFTSLTKGADITNTEIREYKIKEIKP